MQYVVVAFQDSLTKGGGLPIACTKPRVGKGSAVQLGRGSLHVAGIQQEMLPVQDQGDRICAGEGLPASLAGSGVIFPGIWPILKAATEETASRALAI